MNFRIVEPNELISLEKLLLSHRIYIVVASKLIPLRVLELKRALTITDIGQDITHNFY